MEGILFLAILLALTPLALILFEVIRRGASAMNIEFLTSVQNISLIREGGGYLNGLVGTLYMVAIASIIAVPLGVATATYVVEYSDSKLVPFIQFFTDVMTGVPSIFVGLFIYTILVQGGGGFSTLAGGLALSLLMIPIIARASEEVIRLVPDDLRNAAYGLGARRWQVVMQIVLPTAGSGLITASMLAVARAAGETAPLLLTALGAFKIVPELLGSPQAALPLIIFNEARGPFEPAHARAWAGALELMLLVLLLTLIARAIGRKTEAAI
ncbi:MAG: phosphate ABC transporter permease PstA [Ardenticatenaceae bacterium]|nr:phosphate ABC transporter permease PstA [Ardenticatenaceae bacterium]MCB9003225.1 phosphate ABC transporter permease PstA [Ardenticatenaceae bacterium]